MNINQAYLNKFENYGIETHNTAEINKLTMLRFENNDETIHKNSKLVLVLVSPKLTSSHTILTRLERMKGDLLGDGYKSRFIKADIYRGAMHQDGRAVLAMRDFSQENKRSYTWGIVGNCTLKKTHRKIRVVRRHQDTHAPGFYSNE